MHDCILFEICCSEYCYIVPIADIYFTDYVNFANIILKNISVFYQFFIHVP